VPKTGLPDRSLDWYEKPVFLTDHLAGEKTGLPDQSLGWYETPVCLTNHLTGMKNRSS